MSGAQFHVQNYISCRLGLRTVWAVSLADLLHGDIKTFVCCLLFFQGISFYWFFNKNVISSFLLLFGSFKLYTLNITLHMYLHYAQQILSINPPPFPSSPVLNGQQETGWIKTKLNNNFTLALHYFLQVFRVPLIKNCKISYQFFHLLLFYISFSSR